MDIIHLLPDSVANQIAAGEVIQRPASVVKELVENAIDAGASHIDVSVTDAGKTCVQVIDDGRGMSDTDARMAFERHATSKISAAADLYSLRTMGFRGEALASIAAVAQVELRTCHENSQGFGTVVRIEGSRVVSQEPAAHAVGTSLSVKNLFFNVPARRKFLKSNQTELSAILAEFERTVLVNPGIAFTLSHNGTQMFNLPATQLRQRILGVFGKKLNGELLPVYADTTLVRISGFVGRPESARKKGARQFFFTNGRYMRHPYFHRAVADAYERLIPTGEQMSYFIYFETDPANVDVNVHPQKTEIKFESEQSVWQILNAAVKETLGRFNEVPSIDFDTEGRPDIPACGQASYLPDHNTAPRTRTDSSYNPFLTGRDPSYTPSKRTDWQPLYQGLDASRDAKEWEIPDTEYVEQTPAQEDPVLPLSGGAARHYCHKGRYILTSVKSGLMIIDQRRAHVCILYHEYLQALASHSHPSQRLLFPEMVHLSPSEIPVLESITDDLAALGFQVAALSGGSFAVSAVPAGAEGVDAASLLTGLVRTAAETGGKLRDEVQSAIALSMARAAAILPGRILTDEEASDIVDRLFAVPSPNLTPDGKVVLSLLKEEDLDKMFR